MNFLYKKILILANNCCSYLKISYKSGFLNHSVCIMGEHIIIGIVLNNRPDSSLKSKMNLCCFTATSSLLLSANYINNVNNYIYAIMYHRHCSCIQSLL